MADKREIWASEFYNRKDTMSRVSGKDDFTMLCNHNDFMEEWHEYMDEWEDNFSMD